MTVLSLYDSPLCKKETFFILSEKLVKKLNKCCVFYIIFLTTCGIISTIGCYINYWFNIVGVNVMLWEYPFETSCFPAYDLSLFYQFVTGLHCILKICTTEGFFVALVLYLNFCYKQHGDMYEDAFGRNEVNHENVKSL